jgi:SAM-dependent methyltransferase
MIVDNRGYKMAFMERLQEFLDRFHDGVPRIRVLEAGSGSASYVHFPCVVETVGIDISQRQLDRNITLDQKILGDIQTYPLPLGSYDVVICWDVLEHVARPNLALDNLVRSLKPKGILVLKQPNIMSLKGLLTKALPWRLHLLFYRHAFRTEHRPEDETGPFRTYLRFSTRPRAVREYARKMGLSVVYYDSSDVVDAPYLRKMTLILNTYRLARMVLYLLSNRRISDSDYIIVLQKTESSL